MGLHKDVGETNMHEPKGMTLLVAGATDVGKVVVSKGDGTSETRKLNLTEIGTTTALAKQIAVADGAGAVTAEYGVRMGFADYNDVATVGTPIVLTPVNTFVNLTNDGLGPNTLKTYALPDGGEVWDASTNSLDFSSLALGDTIDIRLDITVTTTGVNHAISLQLDVDVGGGGNYQLPVHLQDFKAAGTYRIVRWYGIYIGDLPTLNGVHKIQACSDTGSTDSVTVNGWYIRTLTRSSY